MPPVTYIDNLIILERTSILFVAETLSGTSDEDQNLERIDVPSERAEAALNLLRVLCALFFIPHLIGKFTWRDKAVGFFLAAGLRPALPFLYVAMGIEVLVAIFMTVGIQTRIASLAAAAYLLVAGALVMKVEKKWLWHLGGSEYPLFWAACCALVAWAV